MDTTRAPRGTGPSTWTLVLVALAALAVLAAACTGEVEQAVDDGPTTIPPAQTLLRVGVEDWPDCLNPITCDSPALREQVLQHVLPVAFEVDAQGEYRPSPLLAGEPSIEAGAGGMTVTYRLDPEARWDDGRPITSSDFRGTWRAVMTTPGADTAGYELITDIDDEDPAVAVATFSAPYGPWKTLFGGNRGWVLQADQLGPDTDVTGRFHDELPFSAAPYRLAAWDEEHAVLARSDEYWAPDRAPAIDQVRLIQVTVADLVEPSAFHLLVPADPDPDVTPSGFERRTLPTTGVLGVWFDRRSAILEPLLHRQALSLLIDREALVVSVGGDESGSIDCLGWIPELGPWCDAAAADLPGADPALAVFLLATAGWAANESGDIVRDGQPFAVPLSHDPEVPGATVVADEVAESLEASGITVVRYEVATETWQATRGADPQTGVGVFGFDLGVSPQVDDLYACPEGATTSVLWWCPAEVLEPARELASTVDPDAQLELVSRIGEVAASDVAWLPVVRQTRTSFVQEGVVDVPDGDAVVVGPLDRLHGFSMDG